MLGDLLSNPLRDVLAGEVVAVPTRGVERWLTQQLSTRLGVTPARADGVCANVEFPFPGSLVGSAVAAASGIDPDRDPWVPERAVWPLLSLVDRCVDEPWLSPLAAHLRNAAPPGELRRFAPARHVVDLYDRYGVHRPEMLRAWAAGEDDLPRESRWQAELWRRLRAEIGVPSPAERHDEACGRLRSTADLVDLPERVSLFGLTRLPATYLDVLAALGVHRDVHLFLLHPSAVLWERVAVAMPSPPRGLRRAEDPTSAAPSNSLLESWGHDAREMQLVVASSIGDYLDHHSGVTAQPPTLLGRIQADIRRDDAPPGLPLPGRDDGRMILDPGDDSIQVHACHGRARQVEVLRDAVLHLLEEHRDLEPRDVIVMCPDIEAYAPLIRATFDTYDSEGTDTEVGPAIDIPVRLADRSLRQTNPLLGVVARLLELGAARVTASQVLDLASREPVRRRFGFDDDELSRLEEWVVGACIHWGLDANHRGLFKLTGLEANTWRAGLDRTLLGATMADENERRFGDVVPLDDVDSSDIDLAGRFAELIDRLDAVVTRFSRAQAIKGWVDGLAEAAAALTMTTDRDAWQTAQLHYLLDDITDGATADGATSNAPLTLGDVTALLADRLQGQPTRANFRTGQLTICTLVPMRSVPHRVICLLGLDDGSFPRHTQRDGDDLILADPHVGDRDARSEDRQLLLDALLAATDHLVITYTGRDERTNLKRPPAVPLGELLDVIDRTARLGGPGAVRDRVVIHHPLQPFDERNFMPGALVAERPWSFDATNLAGAEVLREGTQPTGAFLAAPLNRQESATIELDQLERFVRHPVGAFLRFRLGITLADRSSDIDDALAVELDQLDQWGVGERLLIARMAGADVDECVAAERARGLLPPGALAEPILHEVVTAVEALVAVAVASNDVEPESLDINLSLPDGPTLIGTVAGIRGDLLHHVTYSRLGANHRLLAWLRLLALTAAHPERPFEAVTIGRRRDGASRRVRVSTSRIRSLGADADARRAAATAHLEALVDLFHRGMREPLPLYCKTSAAWAETSERGRGDPATAAKEQWTNWKFPKEDKDPAHRLVFGEVRAFEDLLAEPPRSDEAGDGWENAETTRFGRYARRLWNGLLDHESVTNQ
jgi:exodeoxyribonuclease V gamma subunit